MRKTRSALLGLALVSVLAGTVAYAGFKTHWPVYIDSTWHNAYGTLGSTRNTADLDSYITCTVYTYKSGPTVYTYCVAQSAGAYGSCWSSQPHIAQVATSVSGDSFISFYWDAATNECTYLEVANSSSYEPKR
jgi:hypothetical protein